ncbi:MAG: hypothetical protein HYX52_01515 [Chloroflexi bacterium]|nr:hypothetical protein [Chloroflexota bacterium]
MTDEQFVYDLEVEDTHRYFADGILVSNCHEFKGKGTAQGLAAAALAEACPKTLILTGTLLGGYRSTLFHLMYRFSPAIRAEFGHNDEAKWVSRYGYVARITKKDADVRLDDGRQSKRRTYPTRMVEKPGVTPGVLFHLIGNSVFLRLPDVAAQLPPYSEHIHVLPLEEETRGDEPSQASCYRRLSGDLRAAVSQALARGSKRLLGTYLQALLAWPDGCTREETVLDPRTKEVIGHAPALPAERVYPKEHAILDLALRERDRGWRVLVYLTHTDTRDLTSRLRSVLEGRGLRVAVLKADTVAPDRREEWVAARVHEGTDVLLTNPRLVQTGLDLVDFPSLVWAEVDYSVYVLRQASRRSWRIGQRYPVEVSYFVYDQTLQAEALSLVAAKTRASLMVEGELPEEGLAALDGDGGDVFLALAHKLAEPHGKAADERSLEILFAEARAAEDNEDQLLLDHRVDTIERSCLPDGSAEQSAEVDEVPLLLPGAPSEQSLGRVIRFEQLFRGAAAPQASPLVERGDGATPIVRSVSTWRGRRVPPPCAQHEPCFFLGRQT